jgi:hypothetical protein
MATRLRTEPGRRCGAWAWPVVLLCALALGSLTAARAQSSDAAAKARFAVTLARFVQWPAGSEHTPLRLCVLQNSPSLARAFQNQDGLPVGTRRVAVVLQPPGMSACDLLFVDDSGARAAAHLVAEGAGRPVLTLGAVDGFLAQGGMVELVNVDDALRFDVDLPALRKSGLGLSSQVLKLARRVRDGG